MRHLLILLHCQMDVLMGLKWCCLTSLMQNLKYNLGVTCYWGKANKGFWRLKFTRRKDRFAAKLKGMRRYLWDNLNTKDTMGVIKTVIRVVKGWMNYHAVSGNRQRVIAFISCSE